MDKHDQNVQLQFPTSNLGSDTQICSDKHSAKFTHTTQNQHLITLYEPEEEEEEKLVISAWNSLQMQQW